MPSEPNIVINGTTLSEPQSMAARVAVESYIMQMAKPGALGDDAAGEAVRKGYYSRSAEVAILMIGTPKSGNNPTFALIDEVDMTPATIESQQDCGVKLKPLNFQQDHSGNWWANSACGQYTAGEIHGHVYLSLNGLSLMGSPFPCSLHDAFAVAADHRRSRIMADIA
jgi:hypothetical protein